MLLPLLPAAAQVEDTAVPAAIAPVFRKWSQTALYRPADSCCGTFEYKSGRTVRVVTVAGKSFTGLCSSGMGAWELFSTASPALTSVRSGKFRAEGGDAVAVCRALVAPLASGLELAEKSVTLPDLKKYFRALPAPSASFVGRVRISLVKDLRRQLTPQCKTQAVLIGKWAPEAGEGYGKWDVSGRACKGGVISFSPGREPPNAQVLSGPRWNATARAVASQAVGRYSLPPQPHARTHGRKLFDKVTLVIAVVAIPAGGVYLVATSPQKDGIHAGRLAGGIVLTAFGSLLACVALGPCAV